LNTELVYEKFIETNYNKSSVIEFNPVDEGEYMIVATGRDSKNITIRSETRFYVSEQVGEYNSTLKIENYLSLLDL